MSSLTFSNILHLSTLPSDESIIFKESSFFKHHAALPSPDEVRQVVNSNSPLSPHDPNIAVLVPFPALSLMVKFSRYTTIAEGQCLWAIRRVLKTALPVPEVYGWRRDGESTFIYMELIEGITLEKRWDNLSAREREEICEELSRMVNAMRCVEQSPDESFVGHIGRQPLQDVIFFSSNSLNPGPFSDVSHFHDYFVDPNYHFTPNLPHPLRPSLPDNVPIKFTHGDLHRSNIMLSQDGPPRIIAIIDWHQSGWLPEYWEFCKAMYTIRPGDEWQDFVSTFLTREDEAYKVWEYLTLSLGV